MTDRPETRRPTVGTIGPVESVARWLDDRTGAAKFATKTLRKPFPGHWSFLLGEVAAFCLVILVLTGTFLAFFYRPETVEVTYDGPYGPLQGREVSAAFDSVMRLSFEVRAGLLMRQIHHHAANVFMVSIFLHMMRTFFTGAFRRPRELMWLTGMILVIAGIGAGFTGYSLPDDLLSGTGLAIGYSTLMSIPFIGPFLAFIGLGGEFPGPDLIPRLYILHVMILPGALVLLTTVHVGLLLRVRHTQHTGEGRTERNVTGLPLFPSQTMVTTATFAATAAVLALMGGLWQINPVWLYGPFEAARAFAPAQPDWYVGWLEGVYRLWPDWALRIGPVLIPQPFIPGVVIPGIIFTVAGAWPWIESRYITHDADEHNLLNAARDVPLRTGIGVGALAFVGVMFVAGSNDVLAARFRWDLETLNYVLRGLLVIGAPLLGWLTYRAMSRLSSAGATGAGTPETATDEA